ncbi:MAG: hypothetical protein KF782_04585 [Labilithrix sp.]|nr:hypothetical protein [Labilithrix sp.]
MSGARTTDWDRGNIAGAVGMLFLASALAGCPKSEGDANKAGGADKAAPPATVSASASPDAAASEVAAGDAKPAGQAATYGGSYKVAPGKMYIPDTKDYGNVKQVKDDPEKHVGEGALTLVVDGDGKITGTVDTGPAAPGLVDGSVIEGELRGVVRRKDPKDDGLTGTFIATRSADGVEGRLSLADTNAAIVREGTFSLKKK